jgi:hypothetical protein
VGLLVLLGVAYPGMVVASLAHAAFSGCWIGCGGTSNPALGVVLSLVGAGLLWTPVAVGLRVAGANSWGARIAGVVVVLLVVGGWVLFSLDPAHADFFVD